MHVCPAVLSICAVRRECMCAPPFSVHVLCAVNASTPRRCVLPIRAQSVNALVILPLSDISICAQRACVGDFADQDWMSHSTLQARACLR